MIDALVQNATQISIDVVTQGVFVPVVLPKTVDVSVSRSFTIKATNQQGKTAYSAPLAVTVAAAPPALTISTGSLSPAQIGVPYSAQIAATGGTPPYAFSIGSGSLPAGMALSQSGAITGTDSTASGSFAFTARVTDSANQTATKPLSIDVAAAPSQAPGWNLPASTLTGPPGVVDAGQYASSPSGLPLTFSLESGALPSPSVTLDPATGRFNNTGPDITFGPITIGADDGSTSGSGGATPSSPPSTTTNADQEWLTKSSAAGVIRAIRFDDSTALGGVGTASANFGCFSNSGNPANLPVIDTSIKPSGKGSLRFDIRSQSFPDGQWYMNFSADLSKRFGANSRHFAQWKMRFSKSWIDTFYLDQYGVAQQGIKQMILGAGDTPTEKFSSCTAAHIVLNTFWQLKFPTFYEGCPSESGSQGLYPIVNGVESYQNKMPSPYCDRTAAIAQGNTSPSQTVPPPGCFGYVADEWMTAGYELALGNRNETTLRWDNCEFRFWLAREHQPSLLLLDWNPSVPGYQGFYHGTGDEQFGKIWFLPYMSYKSVTQITAPASVWYADLIISSMRIADAK